MKQHTPNHERLLKAINVPEAEHSLWLSIAAEMLSPSPDMREQRMFEALHQFAEGQTNKAEWLSNKVLQYRLCF